MDQARGNIYIGQNAISRLSELISSKSFSSLFILADENTVRFCYPRLLERLPPHQLITIKSGEENKHLGTCELVWGRLTDAAADRKALLINLGGGVICDLGGFAAGCYKRGISFIQVPTTLLAMVDASVGAKTGVDFRNFKNQIGMFNEPLAVVMDPGFLSTQSERELSSGFAEVIKHYLIADKAAFESQVTGNQKLSELNWEKIVSENVKIKSSIVEGDPYEQNIRKALNFGHTIGHAVESYFLDDPENRILHGEAVAVGMICESFISENSGLLKESELAEVTRLILRYFKLPAIPVAALPAISDLIKQDKKNEGAKNQFTLLKGIGSYTINQEVNETLIAASINYYNTLVV